jgi:hypothetical protein
VREIVPAVAVGRVVFAHRSPLALRQNRGRILVSGFPIEYLVAIDVSEIVGNHARLLSVSCAGLKTKSGARQLLVSETATIPYATGSSSKRRRQVK